MPATATGALYGLLRACSAFGRVLGLQGASQGTPAGGRGGYILGVRFLQTGGLSVCRFPRKKVGVGVGTLTHLQEIASAQVSEFSIAD